MDSETNDLASLPDLNEEIILNKLKFRYQKDFIYVGF
jgi:myosin heavy subunit